jgi:N-acetyl-1-D-myo-inositol-2-amino-2-deoxy-alpha-D-glucopyranoside deacetylase
MFVHAHPDDEALGTGGTIARYCAEGARVCLVTCTNGEIGEIADVPALGDPEQIRPRLGEVRVAELIEACEQLGDVDLRLLGFRDSGMAGTPANGDPRAFINQDPEGVVRKIVSITREVRPQVLVTYNEIGFYGHPDHIRAHEAALMAAEAAGDPALWPELGEAHEVAKIYFTAVPKSLLLAGRELAENMGLTADDFFSEEEVARVATDDALVTTAVDVSSFIEQKWKAMEAHRTQRGTTGPFLSIPEEYRTLAFGTEHYVLARSSVPAGGIEDDLFAGIH